MAQTLFIPKEIDTNEPRVGGSAETVKKLIGLGFTVIVETGAGTASRIPDREFEAAGATIGKAADVKGADVVLKVRRPATAELKSYKQGAVIIAMLDPYGNDAAVKELADAGVTAFTMEFMPRITRAQVMDVLSSQANLAGYQAVVDAAEEYDRALPMMMTAAGTVPAAKVFIMGVGVAGLQAIATARRLGAVVTATDVRPAVKEQVASLGAKFLAVEDEEFKAAETAGGYAKEMSKEYQAKQAALVNDHIAKQDIVITTALIPGRPAPRLVTREMYSRMRPGSVIIDLAVERGGNVEGAVAGKIVEVDGIKIVGHLNVAGRIAATASQLYAKNLVAFFETLVDKDSKSVKINFDDELVKATVLTHGGKVVHPNFANAAVAAPAAKPAAKKVAPAAKDAPVKAEAKKAAPKKATTPKAAPKKTEGEA
ncbi:Re/Si-specific NAD(P)(+) transhydrogenase subunit alpha [Phyllobacterium zundukense]|uniref:NAD(P) transhydrogenase subunit alpha part 1 n=1 Tax=Phyllobacterium zundukense TaxID=1867719 RepID=A0A2N9VQH1_9HYPH|nr:Re/Si-specific NAD(P)(+) transhydrogenase subunit alpha [Phyllobacterium zundukense]ATU93606.1 NAD(P) transhydrogenase subunit alpha [Phyllobacterium zundukense]PIO41739.1 NAD(P) transhydrogenase subunit alpha [Phyllobacterium zundukense]